MVESDTINVRDMPDYLQGREPTPESEFGEALCARRNGAALRCPRASTDGGNKVQTERVLGISRAKLYSVLRESSPDEGQPSTLPGE